MSESSNKEDELAHSAAGNEMRARLAYNLRRIRAQKGISQEHMAELAGLHRTYASIAERGLANATIDNIQKFAEALNVDPLELFQKIESSTSAVN